MRIVTVFGDEAETSVKREAAVGGVGIVVDMVFREDIAAEADATLLGEALTKLLSKEKGVWHRIGVPVVKEVKIRYLTLIDEVVVWQGVCSYTVLVVATVCLKGLKSSSLTAMRVYWAA